MTHLGIGIVAIPILC